jgi:hypothetical protein
MTTWVPDYEFEAGDGHVWARPVAASEDCPDCSCCTKNLCTKAGAAELPCWWIVGNRGPGTADVSECPCGQKIEDRATARSYLNASPEERAEYEQDCAPEQLARIKQLAAEIENEGAAS